MHKPHYLKLSLLIPALISLQLIITAIAHTQTTHVPPVAVSESYLVHGRLEMPATGGLLANDSDPDGDLIFVEGDNRFPITTAHGNIKYNGDGSFTYTPNVGYVGTDSFTYRVCDNWDCSQSTATATFNVQNDPPNATPDFYSIQKQFHLDAPGLLANDSDSDGDPIRISGDLRLPFQTAHGIILLESSGAFTYTPNFGYIGTDSFSFTVCDNLEACSGETVTFDIVNAAPDAGPDIYKVYRHLVENAQLGLLVNDSDPNGDPIRIDGDLRQPFATEHGFIKLESDGGFDYIPNSGYLGLDRFTYTVCDNLGACSAGVIKFIVVDAPDKSNAGLTDCHKQVGAPINVTNGNMYLQQTDYRLPGIGEQIDVTRTYNSSSQSIGLFGRGWSTAYDESVKVFGGLVMQLTLRDGRAVYFTRESTSAAFTVVEQDFHDQLSQNPDGSFTLAFKDGRSHQFNAAGKLISLADRNGNQTPLTYGAGNRLSSITNPFGRVLDVTTDTNGQVLSIADSLGTVATYVYGADHELLSVTYADNSRFQFAYGYSPDLVLLSVTDALGNVVESHTYDWMGRALTSEKQDGVERVTLNYVSDVETDVTDALGRVTKYFLDKTKGRNLVTRVEGMCSCGGGSGSQVQTWEYDAQFNVLTKTDALGRTKTYTYDGSGNRLTETDAKGTVTYTYNQLGEVLTFTDQLGGVTTFTYDAQGRLLSIKDALNRTTVMTYDSHGLLLSVTDARNNRTEFSYDANGNLTQKKDALNHITAFVSDARGRLVSTTDALNNSTAFAYDAAGRLENVTRADSTHVTATYDLAGRRTSVTDPRQNSTTYAYDGAYRLLTVTDAANQSTTYSYDLMSNLASVTDALGRTTNYEYDDFNRLKKVTYPPATSGATRLTETIAYDAVGNVTKRTDTAGRDTLYEYDAANRMVKTTDAALGLTQYEYNARSEVTAVVDAVNQRYSFGYDAMGRATTMTRAGHTMSFVYDAVGNRTSRTDYNGVTTAYSFDELNRLTTISYPDATTASYGYDALSRLTTATNPAGTVTFSYDSLSLVLTTTDVFGRSISYTYDAAGNRATLSMGQRSIAYSYDAVNRLTQLTEGGQSVGYSYNAVSQPLSRTLANGVATTYSYDGLGRLINQLEQNGQTLIAERAYQYNNAVQVAQVTEAGTGEQAGVNIEHAYSYDSLDRLTGVERTNSALDNESYGYDAVGNRTTAWQTEGYQYQPFNKLVSTDSGLSYTYDANGNLTSKSDALAISGAHWQYTWDAENRLVQASFPPTTNTVNYSYDALGRRVSRSGSSERAEYTYDGQDVIFESRRDLHFLAYNRTSTVEYLNGPGIDNHLRMKDDQSGTYYFTVDHLGSTRELTDESGEVAERVEYDSYGNGSSSLTRYGYTGRESDEQTGLYYYRARWYDASIGRFISEDPVGFSGGINFYAYVKNNPLNLIDPEGTQFRADRDRPGDQYPGMKEPYQPGKPDWRELRCAFVGLANQLDGYNPWLTGEVGAGVHILVLPGFNGSIGAMLNPITLQLCFYTRVCIRLGVGVLAGVGGNVGASLGPSSGDKIDGSSSTSLAGEILVPEGGRGRISHGSSGNVGPSGLGFSIGPGLGAGFSVGVERCYTKILYCLFTPDCPCNKG
jgi:RHS repeat-associated protein